VYQCQTTAVRQKTQKNAVIVFRRGPINFCIYIYIYTILVHMLRHPAVPHGQAMTAQWKDSRIVEAGRWSDRAFRKRTPQGVCYLGTNVSRTSRNLWVDDFLSRLVVYVIAPWRVVQVAGFLKIEKKTRLRKSSASLEDVEELVVPCHSECNSTGWHGHFT